MECSQSVSQSVNQTCDSCVTLIAVPWFCGVMDENSRFVQVPGDVILSCQLFRTVPECEREVDTIPHFCWLHSIVYGAEQELCLSKDKARPIK